MSVPGLVCRELQPSVTDRVASTTEMHCHSSGGQKPKIQVLAELVSSEQSWV